MLKKLMLTGIAVAMTTLNAPIAHAAVVRSGCGFDAISHPLVSGGSDVYTGLAYGYAVFDDVRTHTLRCYVTVDGWEDLSGGTTPTNSGAVFLATAGQVVYHAPEGATVGLCTEIDGVTVSCGPATEMQIPPQEVIDLLEGLEYTLDTIICPLLASASPGIPGVVDITPEGDTTIAVLGPFWDCPPYGNLFPPA